MARVATIEAALLLDAKQWDRGFNDATRRLRTFEKATGSTMAGVATALASSALSVATLGTAFAGAIAVTQSFDAALRRLNTITELGESALTNYGDKLRTLSLEIGATTGATQNAAVAYEVASAGFLEASDNTAVLTTTLKALTAGGGDASQAAKLIAGSLRAYGAEAKDSERYADVFFATVKNGITTFPELSASMGQVTGVAAKAGVSIEELGAAVATATSQGQNTASVIAGLRTTILALQAPTQQSKEEMSRLGIEVNETTLRSDGLAKTIQKMAKANGGSAESFKKLLGSAEGVTLALALASNGGDDFIKSAEGMKNVAGSLDGAVAEMSKSFEASFGQFKVALEAAGIAIGEVFLPSLKLMVDTAVAGVKIFLAIPKPLRDIGVISGTAAVGLLASAQAMAGLTLLFPQLAGTLSVANVAMALNTKVSLANTGATLGNIASKASAILSTGSLTGATVASTAALSTQAAAMVAVQSASLGLATGATSAAVATTGLAAAVGTLGLAMGGLVLIAAAYVAATKFAEWNDARVKAADDAVNDLAKSTAKLGDALRDANKSARELFSAGKTSKDLAFEIIALDRAAENLKDSFDAGNLSLANYEKQLRKLAESRAKLATENAKLKEIERNEGPIEPPKPAPPVDQKELDKQRKEQEKKAEQARKDALEEDLSSIRQLARAREIEKEEEISRLEAVLKKHKVTADERRRIEEQIAGLRGQLVGDAEAREREQVTAAEQKRRDALAEELSRIRDLRTEQQISAAEEIRLLQNVLKTFETTEQEKRSIHSETLKIKARADREAEKERETRQKEAEAKAKKEAEALAGARDRGTDLEQEKNTRVVQRLQLQTETDGVDNREAIKKKLEENLALEIAQIRAASEREKATAQSAELRAQIEANAEAEIRAEISRTAETQKQAIDSQIAALEKLKQAKKKEAEDEAIRGPFGIEELADRLRLERATTSRFRVPEEEKSKVVGETVEEIEQRLAVRVEDVTVKAPGFEAAINQLSARLGDVKLSAIQPPSLAQPINLGAQGYAQRAQNFSGTLDIKVTAEGAKIDEVTASTLDGRYSEISRAAGSMAGRIAFGGG